MNTKARSTLQLLRFHFSFFLMPVYFFALSQVNHINWYNAALVFVILHLLVYPASNGYNSYMDRDTSPIGGLKNPLQPTTQLFVVTVCMDITAVVLSFFITWLFALGVFLYIIASRAYSYRKIRLKKFPVAGYMTVVIFQGAVTFFLVYHGTDSNHTTHVPVISTIASSLLIGGFYPLTQIYQHEEDIKDGVKTISYVLGYTGTFIFTGIVYVLAFCMLGLQFCLNLEGTKFIILQTFMIPVLVYFFVWFKKVIKNKKEANFKNTMQMNLLASTCTNLGFITLLILHSLSKIVSISTSVPCYRHEQKDILTFMQRVYAMNEADKRKLRFLYNQSAIDTRYSVLPDYTLNACDWQFYPATENLEPFPNLETRMKWYNKTAPALSVSAIEKCIDNKLLKDEITHLITVSCTGISAPGLDLQIMEEMDLPASIFRTSVNFMGCYAAIHGLKLADAFCSNDKTARVLVVCTELSTLHFQRENTPDNISSSLLFGDGAAAMLITHDDNEMHGLKINSFYSEVAFKGKEDMSWELSSSGFLMTLSGYVADLIEQDFRKLLCSALENAGLNKRDISHWCIHPGGKRILTSIEKSIDITSDDLQHSYNVLKNYGNMSSPTILFVLKEIMDSLKNNKEKRLNIFGAAFGPGLTLETFILSND